MSNEQDVYEFSAVDLAGANRSLSEFRDKVLLIVNTASQCGFTPQYKDLEELFRSHHDRGLVVLGFPCNQFGGQEPGADAEIASFCEARFGVTFPMFGKVDVNGPHAHPLFLWLKAQAPGLLGSKDIKWNFTKFLLGRDGRAIDRFAPTTNPRSLVPAVEKALAA